MYAKELLTILENNVAPLSLSDECCKDYGHYDNSGIIVDSGEQIRAVLFSLDLSTQSVKKAIEVGANCIVTHHPAIYYAIKSLDTVNSVQAKNLADCIKNGISVISMHLNFDTAKEGIDYYLARALGGDNETVMDKLSEGAYGRVYEIENVSLSKFVENTKRSLKTDRVVVYGNGDRIIKKCASFCGAGCDLRAIDFAIAQDADVFVSSDISHHLICELVERGACVVCLTHYSSETYGFEQITNKIIEVLSVPAYFYEDERFM